MSAPRRPTGPGGTKRKKVKRPKSLPLLLTLPPPSLVRRVIFPLHEILPHGGDGYKMMKYIWECSQTTFLAYRPPNKFWMRHEWRKDQRNEHRCNAAKKSRIT